MQASADLGEAMKKHVVTIRCNSIGLALFTKSLKWTQCPLKKNLIFRVNIRVLYIPAYVRGLGSLNLHKVGLQPSH